MVKIIMFEKICDSNGEWTYKISSKIVSEKVYNTLSNDPQFEHLSYIDLKDTLGLDIEYTPEDDECDCEVDFIDDETEGNMYQIEPDISGAVDLIREQDYDEAIETMKRFVDRVIYAAQEIAYDDIAKIASKKSVMRQIDRETLDNQLDDDEE